MQLTFRSLRRFGLDFSQVDKKVTTTGLRNYKIEEKRNIEGYVSKNFNTKEQLHTVIMIHEWWGLNESITRTADIFSNQNIRVFVPDLFRDDAANNAEVSISICRKPATKWKTSTGNKLSKTLKTPRNT